MLRSTFLALITVAGVLTAGCADPGAFGGGPRYGESPAESAATRDRSGRILSIDAIRLDERYQLGVGTAVGAVAGAILGRQIGGGSGRNVATVVGAAAGAAAGTMAESRMKQRDAQRIVVQMYSGGEVTITQPVDARLSQGADVVIQGSGESARVVPR